MLLAALLGPQAAIITLASVLLIQCLFFADGGLLAYGCNVFNMGVPSAILAYTFIYKPIVQGGMSKARITLGSVLACVLGLQVGAFLVVLETLASGVTELPFGTFVLLMQPIHLAIGLVEGLITAAVLCFVQQARPELLDSTVSNEKVGPAVQVKTVLAVLAVVTVLVAGGLSIFASAYPDGLEWSMEKTAGTAELERGGGAYSAMADIQDKTAFLPDYGFKSAEGEEPSEAAAIAGTSVSGIVGSVITVILAGGLGLLIHQIRRKQPQRAAA
jgi:cobalt/nickel transport system permease protein